MISSPLKSQVVKPPKEMPDGKKVFLAGSIEMGAAENWQEKVERLLAKSDWIILNPRRDDWDSSWKQGIEHQQFREQVEWELEGLEKSDAVILYFDKDTKSPISLLELGLFAHTGKLIVICPDGFWRKWNVDIVCKRYGVRTAETIEEAISSL